MNYRVILQNLSKVLAIEGILMLVPVITSLCYCEWSVALAYGAVAVGSLVVGVVCALIFKPKDGIIFSREGLITAGLSWVLLSLVGAIPFVITGEIPSYIDAIFETVSGFTTTGATILTDVEAISYGSLMWRSFTHWVGGMGVLVFVIAVTKSSSDRNIHIMRAEMPGPIVDKLTPRSKDTAKILYYIYIGMTALLVVLLLCGGMDLFESLLHAFGTAGTGGFCMKNSGLADYNAYLQWVIAIFMMIFGVNFNIYYLILIKKISSAIKSSELWTYIGIILVAVAIITANIVSTVGSFPDAVRHAFFQVTSIISTTGYSIVDFSAWNQMSKTVLLILMFIGGCAGSTAGGLKVARIILLFKASRHELKRVLHPRTQSAIKFEGKTVDDKTIQGVNIYIALYLFIFLAVLILISLEPSLSFEANFSAVTSCLNNVGPGFAEIFASYSAYSPLSKIVLSVAMLLGRLEIYPLLLLFAPSTWKNK